MTFRKTLFWLHLITGCLAGLVILIMCVTGVLLAYQRQILSWMDRDLRPAAFSTGSARLPFSALLNAVSTRHAEPPTAITVRADAKAPVEVSFGRGTSLSGRRLFRPGARRELAAGVAPFFSRWRTGTVGWGTSNEHRPIGRAITGACNFGFLILVLSGPFLWMPRRWSWAERESRRPFPPQCVGAREGFQLGTT
ncbi:MAG: PepSY-associated TM helix domain-containing protein [Ignavibacteriota bacterium]